MERWFVCKLNKINWNGDIVGGIDNAVALARPSREASRAAVDARIASLRGEPFADAIAYVLRSAAERVDLRDGEIEALVAACRTWESARPARRELTLSQELVCHKACLDGRRPANWAALVVSIHYEIARRL